MKIPRYNPLQTHPISLRTSFISPYFIITTTMEGPPLVSHGYLGDCGKMPGEATAWKEKKGILSSLFAINTTLSTKANHVFLLPNLNPTGPKVS